MVTALRPIEVRIAAACEVPKVAAALADAFINDPVFTFLRPGRLRQRARLRTMFVVEMEQYVLANGGTVWTTSGYDGAVAELPPGAWEMPKSATGKETLKWMWAFRTRLPRAIRVQRVMAERHLRQPHFYVRTVGVRTALQGQGLGSMLMQPTLERADSAALPTYIEASSERSAALYERLGFLHMVCLTCQKAALRFGRCVGLRHFRRTASAPWSSDDSLGTGFGDRFEAYRGGSRRFKDGVRQAEELAVLQGKRASKRCSLAA